MKVENTSQASSKVKAMASASTLTPESSTETVSTAASETKVEKVVTSESQSKQVSQREPGNKKQVSKGNQVQQRKAKTESGLDTQAKGKAGTKRSAVDTENSPKDNTEGTISV